MVPGFDDKIRASNTSDDLALTVSVRESDKAKPYIPRSSVINDGWSKDDEATATCYCGTVQLAFVSTESYSSKESALFPSSPILLYY